MPFLLSLLNDEKHLLSINRKEYFSENFKMNSNWSVSVLCHQDCGKGLSIVWRLFLLPKNCMENVGEKKITIARILYFTVFTSSCDRPFNDYTKESHRECTHPPPPPNKYCRHLVYFLLVRGSKQTK